MSNATAFQQNGYCVVQSAISDELRDFVTQYALFDEMQDFSPDSAQVPNAHAKYADPAMETLLNNLHLVMEQHTGLKLFPTYSFYRVYREGDELTAHKDRPSCEISSTLCFNYSYDSKQYDWPIYVENKKIILQPGDMLIYKGCDLQHWREPFQSEDSDAWHVQGFFHYVDADGPYKEYKNDQRESIGLLRDYQKKQRFVKPYIQYTKGSL